MEALWYPQTVMSMPSSPIPLHNGCLLPALRFVLCAIILFGGACTKSEAPGPRKSLREKAEEQEVPPPPTADQLDPRTGRILEVRDHAWLCKRDTDIFLTNRERTKEDRDFFESRIAKGMLVELPAGVRVERQPGPAKRVKMRNGTTRTYVRVEVLDEEFNDDRGRRLRGLVALDSLVKVR